MAGDGLAGLMLTRALRERGVPAVLYGDGRANTPPVGLVHLYAGRTFRRAPVELDAFREATRFWRGVGPAREHLVTREFVPGDRLDRSLVHAPAEFRPRQIAPGRVSYGPGFSIAAQEFAAGLKAELKVVNRRLEQPRGTTVWANGLEFAGQLSQVRWDHSAGRLVTARPRPEEILIGNGVHLAPHPRDSTVVIGGSGVEELERAGALAGSSFAPIDVWTGERLAPALDRRPVLGWLRPGEFLFGGFGSRALFWLPLAVKLAVDALLEEAPLPEPLHWRRLLP